MRTQIKADQYGYVTVHYDDVDDIRRERVFRVPAQGGYVRERQGYNWVQVCDRLSTRGPTLWCRSREALPDLIRKEWRKSSKQ